MLGTYPNMYPFFENEQKNQMKHLKSYESALRERLASEKDYQRKYKESTIAENEKMLNYMNQLRKDVQQLKQLEKESSQERDALEHWEKDDFVWKGTQ